MNIPSSSNAYDGEHADPLSLAIPEARVDYYLKAQWKSLYHRIINAFKPSKHYSLVYVTPNANHLITIATYYESKAVLPVVDKLYDIDHVREALGYIEQGHCGGKTVITVASEVM